MSLFINTLLGCDSLRRKKYFQWLYHVLRHPMWDALKCEILYIVKWMECHTFTTVLTHKTHEVRFIFDVLCVQTLFVNLDSKQEMNGMCIFFSADLLATIQKAFIPGIVQSQLPLFVIRRSSSYRPGSGSGEECHGARTWSVRPAHAVMPCLLLQPDHAPHHSKQDGNFLTQSSLLYTHMIGFQQNTQILFQNLLLCVPKYASASCWLKIVSVWWYQAVL